MDDEAIAALAILQEEIIEEIKVTDWSRNLDVQNQIRRRFDDAFYALEEQYELSLDDAGRSSLIERLIDVAKARDKGTS